jgi:hypothetical protein
MASPHLEHVGGARWIPSFHSAPTTAPRFAPVPLPLFSARRGWDPAPVTVTMTMTVVLPSRSCHDRQRSAAPIHTHRITRGNGHDGYCSTYGCRVGTVANVSPSRNLGRQRFEQDTTHVIHTRNKVTHAGIFLLDNAW